jgi:hypothetical protein
MSNQFVRCSKPFAMFEGKRPRVFKAGQMVDADDDVVLAYPGNFEEPDESSRRQVRNLMAAQRRVNVEQATSAPGEVRDITPPQPTPEPEPESDLEPERTYDYGDLVEPAADEDDVEAEEGVERPRDYAPKGAWLDYARANGYQGEDNDHTKEQLIEYYG